MSVEVGSEGADGLDAAMAVMRVAFDRCYGEAWTAPQCASVLAMPGADLLVARASDDAGQSTEALLGFALLRTVVGETELMLIAVVPEARRRGVAHALLRHGMASARTRGATRFLLEVRADNPALSLYRLEGLEQVGRRRDYYRGNDGLLRDALTLAREL